MSVGPRRSFSKADAVAGGVRFGPAAPVLIGGAAASVTAVLLPTPHPRTRWSR
ncbi:hypothetical protein PGH47_39510 [Streptomyces sp. HUAS 31]|uniref:hypothetical protein n=1 Tax=Streptomyces TaxID=1883 RepID=UPI00230607BB|nr:hypothetical protein [Streptomyces sp. HUAS 31]WCE01429.1 hypothetical protein PGH47_39510 [Streptomyces sp. HUAS 31]